MADDISGISVQGLYKDFQLPHERRDSLKERLLHFSKPTYEKLHVLKNINLEIKKGEFLGIVGKNGSGKSTLLKSIGGIYQPTAGQVSVNGTLTPFIELGIGFNPELTGRENIYLNGAILGLTRKEIQQKYQEIVDFAELEKFMDQKLKNYSSGMQVRLAFSIAIQAHNDILLIDEVLAVGDTNFQRKCARVFREIKKSGKTVVFVTHDMGAVQQYCDRAIMLQDGKILIEGTPREVAIRYEMANTTAAGSATNSRQLERPRDPVIKIDKIRLLAADRPSTSFSIADDITAEITLDVRRSAEMQINLFLLRPDGVYIGGINSYKDLQTYKPSPGRHTLTCTLQAGQLSKGEYGVGVGVYTPGYIPDLIDIVDRGYSTDVPQISIIDSSNYQDGQIYLQAAWKEVKPK